MRRAANPSPPAGATPFGAGMAPMPGRHRSRALRYRYSRYTLRPPHRTIQRAAVKEDAMGEPRSEIRDGMRIEELVTQHLGVF
jgi:hypothetical protein